MWMVLALTGCISGSWQIPGLPTGDPLPTGDLPTDPPELPDPVTEVFEAAVEPWVDLLFVVDNSSSMGDEQDSLTASFPALFEGLDQGRVEHHIGVVATDVQREEFSGRLRSYGGVRFIDTATPDPLGTFNGMVAGLGTITGSAESGRAAAQLALGDLVDSSFNVGFYRDEAELHIVFVSDTDDNSANNPSRQGFLSWVRGLKTGDERVALHAMVQLPTDTNCGQLRPGTDYLFLADQTGGVQASVCAVDWSPLITEVVDQVRVVRTDFTLEGRPNTSMPITVVVEQPDADGAPQTLVFDDVCVMGQQTPDACDVVYFPASGLLVVSWEGLSPQAILEVTYTPSQ